MSMEVTSIIMEVLKNPMSMIPLALFTVLIFLGINWLRACADKRAEERARRDAEYEDERKWRQLERSREYARTHPLRRVTEVNTEA